MFIILNTDIVFGINDYAGITEDSEEISIHIAKTQETEVVARTLRINKNKHQIYITPIYVASYR